MRISSRTHTWPNLTVGNVPVAQAIALYSEIRLFEIGKQSHKSSILITISGKWWTRSRSSTLLIITWNPILHTTHSSPITMELLENLLISGWNFWTSKADLLKLIMQFSQLMECSRILHQIYWANSDRIYCLRPHNFVCTATKVEKRIFGYSAIYRI